VGGDFKPFENSISVSSPPDALLDAGSLNIYGTSQPIVSQRDGLEDTCLDILREEFGQWNLLGCG